MPVLWTGDTVGFGTEGLGQEEEPALAQPRLAFVEEPVPAVALVAAWRPPRGTTGGDGDE